MDNDVTSSLESFTYSGLPHFVSVSPHMFSYNGFFNAIPPWLYEYYTTRILMIMNRVTYGPGVEKKLIA